MYITTINKKYIKIKKIDVDTPTYYTCLDSSRYSIEKGKVYWFGSFADICGNIFEHPMPEWSTVVKHYSLKTIVRRWWNSTFSKTCKNNVSPVATVDGGENLPALDETSSRFQKGGLLSLKRDVQRLFPGPQKNWKT